MNKKFKKEYNKIYGLKIDKITGLLYKKSRNDIAKNLGISYY